MKNTGLLPSGWRPVAGRIGATALRWWSGFPALLLQAPALAIRALRWTISSLVVAAGILVLVIMFFSGPVADRILANAIGPEDLEMPHTAYPMRQTAELIQTIGGQGEGLDCSLPPGVDFLAFPRRRGMSPISLRMRQACVFHDYCYRHGEATYGYGQADCDYMLQEQAFRLCTQINVNRRIADCETEARKVTLGVRLGGWRAYKRVDAPDTQPGSTYFEFDPYPLRSPMYRVVRVADAPAQWRSEGAFDKAYYVFSMKQSGIELRIVGLGKMRRWCALLDLPASYGVITTPPLVIRSRVDGADWLVWWRRAALTNTEGSFAGIAPGTAGAHDWQRAFGAVEAGGLSDCADAAFATEAPLSAELFPVTLAPPSSFAGLTPTYKRPEEEDQAEFDMFLARDTLVSEFLPQYPGGGASRRNLPLAMYGLTTHGCSSQDDKSTCLAEIEIDPASFDGRALYEPYVANDMRCLGKAHPYYKDAKAARGSEVCDRYRNFNQSPFIAERNGVSELVWIRRGNSVGDAYERSGVLRRAMRRDSTHRGDQYGQPNNFDTFALDDYPEKLEPSALVNGSTLISVREVRMLAWSCLRLFRVSPRGPIQEFLADEAAAGQPTAGVENGGTESFCINGLDKSWIERPWRMLPGGPMLFMRTSLAQTVDKQGLGRWDLSLQVATLPADAAAGTPAVPSDPIVVAGLHSCRSYHGDATWVLQREDCESASVELARGRDKSKQQGAAARIMRSAPVAVADMDGDAIVDIAYLIGDEVAFLKGTRVGDGLDWRLEAVPQ